MKSFRDGLIKEGVIIHGVKISLKDDVDINKIEVVLREFNLSVPEGLSTKEEVEIWLTNIASNEIKAELYYKMYIFNCTYAVIRYDSGELDTYPIAIKSSNKFGPVKGQTFQCSFQFSSLEEAVKAFEQLTNGTRKMHDFDDFLDDIDYVDFF